MAAAVEDQSESSGVQVTPELAAVEATEETQESHVLSEQPSTEENSVEPGRGPVFIIDHRAIEQFDQIPDEFIQRASELRLLLRHASIGVNINDGLNCLMNNFEARRPNFCDRRIPSEQMIYDGKYDRRNWTFEVRGNPGWWDKAYDFIDRVNGLAPNEAYDRGRLHLWVRRCLQWF